MEEFRKKAKITLIIYSVVIAVAVVMLAVLSAVSNTEELGFMEGYRNGFCYGIIGFMAVRVIQYASALKNDEKLKKLFIRETDERVRLIFEKADSASSRVITIGLGLSTIVASFYSMTVFYTLTLIILAAAFVHIAFRFYYSRKY